MSRRRPRANDVEKQRSSSSDAESDLEQPQGAARRVSRTSTKRASYAMYNDDSAYAEVKEKYSLEAKLKSQKFSQKNYNCLLELKGEELTLEYFQRHGFTQPLVVRKNKDNVLKLITPGKNFPIRQVIDYLGPKRMVDVMNTLTQKGFSMTVEEWCDYYESFPRSKKLNVISLEVSNSAFDAIYEPPWIVRMIDWVSMAWPKHLVNAQTDSTNTIENMKYPKVRKYVLMSVEGCFTDFHVDFGGSSVWYHVLRGQKVFWLIPPTEENILKFEEWSHSTEQSNIFFGDVVDQCCRITLEPGNTFFMPSGWIHAVYTPKDSLVFGANFMNSFCIANQLRVWNTENYTQVSNKFRYPFFVELMWYVVARYVHCLMGRNHLSVDDDGNELDYQGQTGADKNRAVGPKVVPYITFEPAEHVNLTRFELEGLPKLIEWLEERPVSSAPSLIISPQKLLSDARLMMENHKDDDPELAITNQSSLFWITRQKTYDGSWWTYFNVPE